MFLWGLYVMYESPKSRLTHDQITFKSHILYVWTRVCSRVTQKESGAERETGMNKETQQAENSEQ